LVLAQTYKDLVGLALSEQQERLIMLLPGHPQSAAATADAIRRLYRASDNASSRALPSWLLYGSRQDGLGYSAPMGEWI